MNTPSNTKHPLLPSQDTQESSSTTPMSSHSVMPGDAATNVKSTAADTSEKDTVNLLLEELKFGVMDGQDTRLLEEKLLIMRVSQEKITAIKHYALARKQEREKVDTLLSHGVCSEGMQQYWQELSTLPPDKERNDAKNRKNAKKTALGRIRFHFRKELESCCRQQGASAAAHLLDQVRTLYGEKAVKDIAILPAWCETEPPLPSLVRGTVHTLSSRTPVMEWDIYIDESGSRFSDREEGTEGCVVAVCVPQGSPLPNLENFHSTEASPADVIQHCNELLQSNVGILGFTVSALGIQGEQGWLQAIRQLVLWVWRLLPLHPEGHTVFLRFHVEQRNVFGNTLATALGEKILTTEMEHEDAERAQHMSLASFAFEKKEAPMLAWADVVAYLWNSSDPALQQRFRESGLLNTCLVSFNSHIVDICESIAKGDVPDGAAWIDLMKVKSAEGTLIQWALARLQQQCEAEPKLWEPYARAMEDYLAGKQYDMKVLEGMSRWLRPMNSPGLVAEFFWNAAELARCNHQGDVDSPAFHHAVAELNRLTPKMRMRDPIAPVRVALRLASALSNIFQFAQAEDQLQKWDPRKGGRLTESELWDGKIWSSLGQYRAFQGDNAAAIPLFHKALACFAAWAEADEDDAQKQQEQTYTYLAIATMDSPDGDADRVRAYVEKAVGMSVAGAVTHWGNDPLADSRYQHYLLARYLAYRGTDAERADYRRFSHLWTLPDQGFGVGHPWPQIQYFRWRMVGESDAALRQGVATSLAQTRGSDHDPTVKFIWAAIAISMGELDPRKKDVQDMLRELGTQLPGAEAVVQQLLEATPGDALLAQRVLPFNFC